MKLIANRDLLPEAESERSQFLKKYFCELVASAEQVNEGWCIDLSRPDDANFYIDPELSRGLDWWSSNFGKIDVAGIPLAVHRIQGLQLSLNDSWTLYSWSKWLEESDQSNTTHPSISLLHLDDHDDLMVPRVILEGEAFYDLITGSAIDLWCPETVASAVKSGAVGIGSFMAPLLHRFRNVHVRHLCSTEYSKERQGVHIVRPVVVLDDLLSPGSRRLGLELQRREDHLGAAVQESSHSYIVTDDLSNWLKDLPSGPVLIHIDMDYFNNRFNGDSDWVDYGPKYDPPLANVLSRIDAVFESLENENVAERVVDSAVALSPGFFPSDLWGPSIERILNHVSRLIAANRWVTR